MKKVLLAPILLLLILALIFTLFFIIDDEYVDTPPPTITSNFVDLEKIDEISKYRSCTGHVVVPTSGDERKRNMKHYFNIKDQYRDSTDGIPIYSPFKGEIVDIHDIEGKPLDEEISFAVDGNYWGVSMLHLDILEELNIGDEVESGQLIGYAKQNGFDVVYTISAGPKEQKVIEGWYAPYKELDSIFNHMSDEVFDEYLKAGVESKEQIILTKEQRDAEPCLYRGQAPDLENPNDRDDNWVNIN